MKKKNIMFNKAALAEDVKGLTGIKIVKYLCKIITYDTDTMPGIIN